MRVVIHLCGVTTKRGSFEVSFRGCPRLDINQKKYIFREMWTIVEEKAATKAIDKLPSQVAEKYAFWLAVVQQSGPQGLRVIKGFHDEKLSGKMSRLRSSRLSLQWRVLYSVQASTVTVTVEQVTPHKYRP